LLFAQAIRVQAGFQLGASPLAGFRRSRRQSRHDLQVGIASDAE
jgi:hypothetical protein